MEEFIVLVTGDIDIEGRTVVENAFKPGLTFLQGKFEASQIKKWILELEFIKKEIHKLRIPIIDPYACVVQNTDFRIDYKKLSIVEEGDIYLRVNIPELLGSLKGSLRDNRDNDLVLDNTSFMMDFINEGIKKIKQSKDNNELS